MLKKEKATIIYYRSGDMSPGQMVELEYFCRGLMVADSNKAEWSFDCQNGLFKVFVANQHVRNALKMMFPKFLDEIDAL